MEAPVSDPSGDNAADAANRQTPWTVPNILTWTRIAAIPLVILAFYAPYHWSNVAACVVFAAAGITDTLDGYLARKLGQITRLGAFLDPVADKLIVAAALILLVAQDTRGFVIAMALVIIGREIAISALREWMAELGKRGKVAVNWLGKAKTIFQVVGLTFMLYRNPLLGLPIYEIGVVLTGAAAVLTLVSMLTYIKAAWPDLRA